MNSQEILDLLDKHNIIYQSYDHPAVFTSEEADKYAKNQDFAKCKNLFIKTRNGQQLFMIVLPTSKKLDWKKAVEQLHTSSLTMATEEDLADKLQITPGSVSPFNLLNDSTNTIPLVIDQDALVENDYVGVHPNDNTKTIRISWTDLTRILSSYGHLVEDRQL
ncbi:MULTISPECIES: prolyl-tRNA synthetase associated domain-containing protein [Lactobacillus]|uniref:Prolyl-tRNA synthetase associated domain-containing protein n=1 Tax=Lactobacillus xujianguonis TaxID=2495899 RepID=A0A437SVU4_9LACO|nr:MULTISPECIES: prolyl-tRNA synthetase associated domain-containing protein [Lactobacillus]RVU71012.1 prolyl-tRNA synthetase associated domain-containing protein [Lactobacillus xujianguonis]RVU73918.1 prolyl-tRNA synthetase associated domain-containing protein [Lactobacillus xujianguonis]